MTEITERIVQRMKEQNVEEIDLAAAARVAQSTVNRWTHHFSEPRSRYMPAIAKRLETTVFWVLTGKERDDLPYDERTLLAIWDVLVMAADALEARAKHPPEIDDTQWWEKLRTDCESLDNVPQMLGIPAEGRGRAARKRLADAVRAASAVSKSRDVHGAQPQLESGDVASVRAAKREAAKRQPRGNGPARGK